MQRCHDTAKSKHLVQFKFSTSSHPLHVRWFENSLYSINFDYLWGYCGNY
jgi:hypothetical protein